MPPRSLAPRSTPIVMKAVSDLPARLYGGNAQAVEVAGLDYTLHLDIKKLPEGEGEPLVADKWVAVWDEVSNTYKRINVGKLPLPTDSAPVSITFYGAVAGSADSTTSVQAALNSGHRAIIVPEGVFTCSTLSVPANTTLIIAEGATLRQKAGTTAKFITLAGNGASIRGYGRTSIIDGNGNADPTSSPSPIFASSVDNCTVKGVRVTNSAFLGMHFYNCSRVQILDNFLDNIKSTSIGVWFDAVSIKDIVIARNTINKRDNTVVTDAGDGIDVWHLSGNTALSAINIKISDNVILGVPGRAQAISVFGVKRADLDNVVVTGNLVFGWEVGITVAMANNTTVTGNTVKVGALTNPDSAALTMAIEMAWTSNSTCSANVIDGSAIGVSCTANGTDPDQAAVASVVGENNNIVGNIIHNTGTAAILIANSEYKYIIANNTIQVAAASGIVLTNDIYGSVIVGNNIDGATVGGYALNVDSSLSILIAANHILRWATGTIVNAHASALIYGNVSDAALPETFDLSNSAWAAYTTTLGSATGAPGSATATVHYKRFGKTVHYRIGLNVTTVAPATGYYSVTLPFAAGARSGLLAGAEQASNGLMLYANIAASTNIAQIRYYDNVFRTTAGQNIVLEGSCEVV